MDLFKQTPVMKKLLLLIPALSLAFTAPAQAETQRDGTLASAEEIAKNREEFDKILFDMFGLNVRGKTIAERKRGNMSTCGENSFKAIGKASKTCWPVLKALQDFQNTLEDAGLYLEHKAWREGDGRAQQERLLSEFQALTGRYSSREWPAYDVVLAFTHFSSAMLYMEWEDYPSALEQLDLNEQVIRTSKIDDPQFTVGHLTYFREKITEKMQESESDSNADQGDTAAADAAEAAEPAVQDGDDRWISDLLQRDFRTVRIPPAKQSDLSACGGTDREDILLAIENCQPVLELYRNMIPLMRHYKQYRDLGDDQRRASVQLHSNITREAEKLGKLAEARTYPAYDILLFMSYMTQTIEPAYADDKLAAAIAFYEAQKTVETSAISDPGFRGLPAKLLGQLERFEQREMEHRQQSEEERAGE